jgi:hypothetical protein
VRFSLHSVKSRPAKVGDKLTTHNFNTGTRGFAAPEDVRTAVCVLPGTELAFAKEVRCGQSRLFGWKANTVNHTTAIFRQINKDNPRTHHTVRWCSSRTYSKVRKQQCSSFRHNPLPQPKRQPRNGSRWSADLQAATVFRPPSIGRPVLRAHIVRRVRVPRRQAGMPRFSPTDELSPGVFILAAFLAGVNRMPWRAFLIANASGGPRWLRTCWRGNQTGSESVPRQTKFGRPRAPPPAKVPGR